MVHDRENTHKEKEREGDETSERGGGRGKERQREERELTNGELMCFKNGLEPNTVLPLVCSGERGNEEKDTGRSLFPETGQGQTFSCNKNKNIK